jgi:hypothetical protein
MIFMALYFDPADAHVKAPATERLLANVASAHVDGMNSRLRSCLLAAALCGIACQSSPERAPEEKTAAAEADKAPPAAPAAPAPVATRAPRQEPLSGGPFPALLVSQAQFGDKTLPDGSTVPVPGAAKLTIVRSTDGGFQVTLLEDPDSNVFHKAIGYEGGILSIGGNQAMLKTWRFENGAWRQATHWNPKFGGKFDRLRDVEHADVDGDGAEELVIATHDQGVIAIVHPSEQWRIEQIDAQPDTFVHEIEIGDVDGDGTPELFATPSKPNKLDQEQPGEVTAYRRGPDGWKKSVVDAPKDTHAKEILTADVDQDGKSELYIVWEGAIGGGGTLVRPVTVKQYRFQPADGTWASAVVATVPDRQMRALGAGDVNQDGKVDLVAGGLSSGLWLLEQDGAAWKQTQIAKDSSGFEQPVLVADLDGDGSLEIYVGSEDQGELRRYRWKDGAFEKTVVAPLDKGDITWNVNDAKL